MFQNKKHVKKTSVRMVENAKKLEPMTLVVYVRLDSLGRTVNVITI